MNYTWKVLLRAHRLNSASDGECIAEIKAPGTTKHNEDIAERIARERSEYRTETIMNILSVRDQIVMQFVREGFAFADGAIHLRPRVSGIWENKSAPFSKTAHTCTVNARPSSAFKNLLKQVRVKVLGEVPASAFIKNIVDTTTGLTDGTISIDGTLVIEGRTLKFDEKDPAQGVFFRTVDGTEYKAAKRAAVNKPKQLIVRVPENLPEGKTTLIVRTKLAKNTELNSLRSIVYGRACTARKSTGAH